MALMSITIFHFVHWEWLKKRILIDIATYKNIEDESVANYVGVEVHDNQILVRTEMWGGEEGPRSNAK